MNDTIVSVSYLELTETPAPIPAHLGAERIAAETLQIDEYLDLYKRVGEPVRWDQRLKMSRSELIRLLASASSRIYVLREGDGQPIGFCEFERGCGP